MRLVLAALVLMAGASSAVKAEPLVVEVWKTPTCGCCGDWVQVMRETGFAVEAHDLDDLTMVKQLAGVPPHLGSCHTATVGGYTIEGHVPPAAVRRLLAEKPDLTGLSAPGMPLGSPGMSGPPERFDVVGFGKGEEVVWSTWEGHRRVD